MKLPRQYTTTVEGLEWILNNIDTRQIEFGSGYVGNLMGCLTILKETAKIFELNKELTFLLLKTKNAPREDARLPFPAIFIETSFTLEEAKSDEYFSLRYNGLLLLDLTSVADGMVLDGIKISFEITTNAPILIFGIASYMENDGSSGVLDFIYPLKHHTPEDFRVITTNQTIKELMIKECDLLQTFVMNFIDFINDPEVRIVEKQQSLKSKRRSFTSKPTRIRKIKLTGVLKKYMEDLRRSGNIFKYSHRFWVRGHFRHFDSDFYVNVKGTKKWIPPFIKGDGILINKQYQLTDKRSEKTA